MDRAINEEEIILRYTKMVVAHLITEKHHFRQFQEIAVQLLAQLVIETVKAIAFKVKEILKLQKRIIPNSLHLLVVSEHFKLFSFQQIYQHLAKASQQNACSMSMKNNFLTQVGNKLFSSHMQQTNKYMKESRYANIRYIPPTFTVKISETAFPKKKQIYQLFKTIEKEEQNVMLEAYAMLSFQDASVIDINDDAEEEVIIKGSLKDRVREKYAKAHKINPDFAKFMKGKGQKQPRVSAGKRVTISLIPRQPRAKNNFITIEQPIPSQFQQKVIIIDPSE